MHRVELKDRQRARGHQALSVPNAPCGVERRLGNIRGLRAVLVPNAPCGVERHLQCGCAGGIFEFLMHRVELKACHYDL